MPSGDRDRHRHAEHRAIAEPDQIRRGEGHDTPSVMSCAMPRPATIRISVATIGWMPSTATRNPFHKPQSRPAPSAAAKDHGQRVAVGKARRDRARRSP